MESTRKQLIEVMNNQEGHVSGQELSELLNISRTAVWKHMNDLKKDGYEIEAVQKKGYKILSYPDKVSGNTLQWGLNTKWIGHQLFHYDQVESTQEIVHQMAKQGKPHGTVVVADEQIKGKGRMARGWDSPKGKGIWLSLLLRPNLPPVQAPQLTLLAATVLAKMIDERSALNPQIKWPNDLLVGHKKVSGILTEMQAEQDSIQYIVLGIGMNVNQSEAEIPEDIKYKASSLKIESGETWNIQETIQHLLRLFEQSYDHYERHGFASVKKDWEDYGYRIGEEVTISTMRNTWKASLVGIEPDGALIARNLQGKEEKLYSAEIHWGEGGYHA
ncbi:biotin--[acetyl-CoA-carboxylase] ligase [Halobacillus litoralis]|uniref:biotin--[acetyl-CoA-carboxylase] ligase n=1 Tax=Halobacillus litoralis TaxID=45668 RepID=UPI001CFCEBDC|nr:biotin--[acetyl-CoA-carboxylase] ligase [Halobacillus litoralis]